MCNNKIRNSHRRHIVVSTTNQSPKFQSILERDSSTESLSQNGFDVNAHHFKTITTTEEKTVHKTLKLYNKFNQTVSTGFKSLSGGNEFISNKQNSTAKTFRKNDYEKPVITTDNQINSSRLKNNKD